MPSRWGRPYRVVWRISVHSIGTTASSIHLSLVASRWGHPTGRLWFSPARSPRSLNWFSRLYSFRMGSPFSGLDLTIWSRVKEFLRLGSWERFFRPVLGVSFVILWSAGRLLRRGGFHIQFVFASSGVYVCVPLADEGVGLGPSSSGPVASRPPLAVRSASAALLPLVAVAAQAGGPLLGTPAVSFVLHGVGGVRRAIPSPGPLWRSLRIFCFGSTARRGFAFPPSGALA